ncbi:MAG: aminotransferase class III-fold pyridoxal phosphate-dependent enzyme [Candidatus Thorarchaeota archaeon]
MERYMSSTEKSKALWERAIKLFPGGVSHNIRQFGLPALGAYPPYISHGEGGHIWDVDGNEYVDWWMTHYSQILGHNDPYVRKAIADRLESGIHYGAPNEPQVEYGEKLKDAIPLLEKMRYTSTGSESTMYAVRLSRLFTGRQLIGKTLGGWHGGNDALTYHMSHPYTDDAFYNGVSFDYNDRESLDEMLKQYGHDMAAIIVEPVIGAGGGIPPEHGFLQYLREETESREILLIFDEIITGFRLRYGTAGDELFGVKPDLLTLGKAAAGGMPLGVYGGREDVMNLATPGAEGGRWVGGGTFSSHPLTMTAGIAVLEQLRTKKKNYSQLNKMGDEFRTRLNKILEEMEVPLFGTGYGSINFINCLTHPLNRPLTTPGQLGKLFDYDTQDIFQSYLMQERVFGYHGLGAISFSHTNNDIEFTLDGIKSAVESIVTLKR